MKFIMLGIFIAFLITIGTYKVPVLKARAAALTVPAFSKFSSAGMSVDAGKTGYNTMQVIGASFSKPGGKPTMTIDPIPVLGIDATATNRSVDIKAYNTVIVCKIDNTANTVTIADSTPLTIPLDPLSIQGECATLANINGTWFVR